jgi:hypothetical protein
VAEKFTLPVFVPPKHGCPACTCDEVPPPSEPGYAEAYMAGALAALGLHSHLTEWQNSLCHVHHTLFQAFLPKCAENQKKWAEEAKEKK